jgi:hypothetical protein
VVAWNAFRSLVRNVRRAGLPATLGWMEPIPNFLDESERGSNDENTDTYCTCTIFYSFAFGLLNAFASTAAHSRMTFRWIFPLGDLGTSSMNCSNNISQHENLTGPKTNRRKEHKHTLTPPVNCLCLATSFAVHAWMSASFTLPFEASFSAT